MGARNARKRRAETRKPKRNQTAAFGTKMAVALLKDERVVAKLAEKFDIHPSQIAQWRAHLAEDATGGLYRVYRMQICN